MIEYRDSSPDCWTDEFTLDVIVEDILLLIKTLGLSSVSILSYCVGLKIACVLMTKYPSLVTSIVTIESPVANMT